MSKPLADTFKDNSSHTVGHIFILDILEIILHIYMWTWQSSAIS